MGYKLNEEGWKDVEEIAQSLACLPEGETLRIKDSREAIDRLRYIIYAWFYETGQKPNFKLMRRTPELIEIQRKAVIRPIIVADDTVDQFVSCQLLEIDDESQVTERIRSAIQSDSLTPDQGIRALQEWSRVQGRSKSVDMSMGVK